MPFRQMAQLVKIKPPERKLKQILHDNLDVQRLRLGQNEPAFVKVQPVQNHGSFEQHLRHLPRIPPKANGRLIAQQNIEIVFAALDRSAPKAIFRRPLEVQPFGVRIEEGLLGKKMRHFECARGLCRDLGNIHFGGNFVLYPLDGGLGEMIDFLRRQWHDV